MMPTVVMIHPGALGDVLLALPAINRLRRQFPCHQHMLCANHRIGELLWNCGVIDGWLSVDGSSFSQLFSGSLENGSLIFDWLTRCDRAVAWVRDEAGTLEAVLKAYVPGEVRVCSPFSAGLPSIHQSHRFLDALGETSGEELAPGQLRLPGYLLEIGDTFLLRAGIEGERKVVLLHPGSGSPFKCVRPEVFGEIVDALRHDGFVPVLLEGPADHAAVTQVLRLVKERPIVLRNLDLSTLAAVLARMDLFVGHDSGVSHLAASLGVATVALFGPTAVERWSPLGAHVTVVRTEACRCPDWEAVSRCIERSCLRISPHALLDICRRRLVNCNPSKILTKRLVSEQAV